MLPLRQRALSLSRGSSISRRVRSSASLLLQRYRFRFLPASRAADTPFVRVNGRLRFSRGGALASRGLRTRAMIANRSIASLRFVTARVPRAVSPSRAAFLFAIKRAEGERGETNSLDGRERARLARRKWNSSVISVIFARLITRRILLLAAGEMEGPARRGEGERSERRKGGRGRAGGDRR